MHPSQCSVVLVDNCATDEDELVATLKSIYHDGEHSERIRGLPYFHIKQDVF